MNSETTEQYRWFTIHTKYQGDTDHIDSPREWDTLGKMVMFHNRYTLPNELDLDYKDFTGRDKMKSYLSGEYTDEQCEELWIPQIKYDIVFPISMYDHSWISFSLWARHWFDSGQVGYIVANIPEWSNFVEVERILNKELEDYNQRQQWEFYEYEIEEIGEYVGWFRTEKEALQEAKDSIDHRIKSESKINIYEYEVEVRVTRRVKIQAESIDDADDKLFSADYEIISKSDDEILQHSLLEFKPKH